MATVLHPRSLCPTHKSPPTCTVSLANVSTSFTSSPSLLTHLSLVPFPLSTPLPLLSHSAPHALLRSAHCRTRISTSVRRKRSNPSLTVTSLPSPASLSIPSSSAPPPRKRARKLSPAPPKLKPKSKSKKAAAADLRLHAGVYRSLALLLSRRRSTICPRFTASAFSDGDGDGLFGFVDMDCTMSPPDSELGMEALVEERQGYVLQRQRKAENALLSAQDTLLASRLRSFLIAEGLKPESIDVDIDPFINDLLQQQQHQHYARDEQMEMEVDEDEEEDGSSQTILFTPHSLLRSTPPRFRSESPPRSSAQLSLHTPTPTQAIAALVMRHNTPFPVHARPKMGADATIHRLRARSPLASCIPLVPVQ